MFLIKQGDTSRKVMLLMLDSADHLTGKTGLSLTVTRSKNGGSFAALSGSVAEVANGVYAVTLASGDVDTLGELAIHATATGADPADALRQVVAFDPYSDNIGLFAAALSDTPGSSGSFGRAVAILRAMANGKMTLASGVLKLFGTDDTTQVGVDRTVTGTVPTDFTRA